MKQHYLAGNMNVAFVEVIELNLLLSLLSTLLAEIWTKDV